MVRVRRKEAYLRLLELPMDDVIRIIQTASLMDGGSNNSSVSSKGDAVDQNVMITLRNLGQTMLDNIQVQILLFILLGWLNMDGNIIADMQLLAYNF